MYYIKRTLVAGLSAVHIADACMLLGVIMPVKAVNKTTLTSDYHGG